jgi:hypothetical protein
MRSSNGDTGALVIGTDGFPACEFKPQLENKFEYVFNDEPIKDGSVSNI